MGLFLWLLGCAFTGRQTFLPVDALLRLDPLVFVETLLSSRAWPALLWPGLAVLVSALVLGRAFCGHLCPLGASIDAADKCTARRRGNNDVLTGKWQGLRRIKYWLLALVLGTALTGVSLVFWVAPLPLATRFYGLVVAPALAWAARLGLDMGHPLWSALDVRALLFAEFKTPLFTTAGFVLVFVGLILLAGLIAPRLWCRVLCPAGALLAACGRVPFWRRQVNEACIDCGRCAQRCPMQAIGDDPFATSLQECVLCRTCAEVCPVDAITYPLGPSELAEPDILTENRDAQPPLPSRRNVLIAGSAGLALGVTGLPLIPPAEAVLRPPGSLPEPEFLARCMRCGECVAVCPTTVIQPLWLKAGMLGMFSPGLDTLSGACDPHCNACGQVCPTRAIRPLEGEERMWAKLGTAVVVRKLCLAWEKKKKCLVCDEVCPYDAISLKPEPGNPVWVPHVDESRCAGCGYCEYHCPVPAPKAIVAEPKAQIRHAHAGQWG